MKILFLGPFPTTFVTRDVDILSRKHEVVSQSSIFAKGAGAPWSFFKLTVVTLAKLFTADAVFMWFADYYTFFPTIVGRILGKKVFVVAGGFDVGYIPEWNFGARSRPVRWFAVKNTFRFATHIFPVTQYTMDALNKLLPSHAPATVVFNAIETDVFTFDPSRAREEVILTVSQADTDLEYQRKGLDFFIEVARANPQLRFRMVSLRGRGYERAVQEGGDLKNLEIVKGRIPLEDLLEHFRKAKVYCQFSIEETFGVSVAEAMACGCFPVVTPHPALMEVVGKAGKYTSRDIAVASKDVQEALQRPEQEREIVRRQAMNFSIEQRAQKLLSIVDNA